MVLLSQREGKFILEKVLKTLYDNPNGLVLNEIKKRLKVKSWTKTKMKPLEELKLVEPITIQITKTKPRTPNAYRLTNKGFAYLKYVMNWSGIILAKEVKMLNSDLSALKDDFQISIKQSQDAIRKIGEISKIVSQLEDQDERKLNLNSTLDLQLLLDVIRKHSSSSLRMASSEKVIKEIYSRTAININQLKQQIVDYYMNNKIDLFEGKISDPNYLIVTADGSRYGFIAVK